MGWLTPSRRKAIHDLLPILVAIAASFGLISHASAVTITALCVAVADLLIAVVVGHGIRQAAYALAATTTAGLVAWGVITEDQRGYLMAAVPAIAGIMLAGANTDVTTSDGQPREELRAEDAA